MSVVTSSGGLGGVGSKAVDPIVAAEMAGVKLGGAGSGPPPGISEYGISKFANSSSMAILKNVANVGSIIGGGYALYDEMQQMNQNISAAEKGKDDLENGMLIMYGAQSLGNGINSAVKFAVGGISSYTAMISGYFASRGVQNKYLKGAVSLGVTAGSTVINTLLEPVISRAMRQIQTNFQKSTVKTLEEMGVNTAGAKEWFGDISAFIMNEDVGQQIGVQQELVKRLLAEWFVKGADTEQSIDTLVDMILVHSGKYDNTMRLQHRRAKTVAMLGPAFLQMFKDGELSNDAVSRFWNKWTDMYRQQDTQFWQDVAAKFKLLTNEERDRRWSELMGSIDSFNEPKSAGHILSSAAGLGGSQPIYQPLVDGLSAFQDNAAAFGRGVKNLYLQSVETDGNKTDHIFTDDVGGDSDPFQKGAMSEHWYALMSAFAMSGLGIYAYKKRSRRVPALNDFKKTKESVIPVGKTNEREQDRYMRDQEYDVQKNLEDHSLMVKSSVVKGDTAQYIDNQVSKLPSTKYLDNLTRKIMTDMTPDMPIVPMQTDLENAYAQSILMQTPRSRDYDLRSRDSVGSIAGQYIARKLHLEVGETSTDVGIGATAISKRHLGQKKRMAQLFKKRMDVNKVIQRK